MNFLTEIFNTLLYRPLFNALIFLYQVLPGHDFGIAVIVLTSLIRIGLSPLMLRSLKSQKVMVEVQKEIKAIQQKHKENFEKQKEEISAVYKKRQINPFDGFIFLLIQLPILIALYRVFWMGMRPEELGLLYSFVSKPETIQFQFLNIINLSEPSLALSVVAGLMQFIQSKTISRANKTETPKGNEKKMTDIMSNQMLYLFPVLTVLILLRLPAAVGLYWIVTTVFSIIQQNLIFKT